MGTLLVSKIGSRRVLRRQFGFQKQVWKASWHSKLIYDAFAEFAELFFGLFWRPKEAKMKPISSSENVKK